MIAVILFIMMQSWALGPKQPGLSSGTGRRDVRSLVVVFVNSRFSSAHIQYAGIAAESTLCLKKVPAFKLSATLSNLNRF